MHTNDLILTEYEIAEDEALVAGAPQVRYCKDFSVIPDEENREIIIASTEDGAILKIGKERAAMLVEIINHLLQSW